MYNPLYQLTPKVLEGLIKQGNLYWVKQSYPRGIEMGIDQSFLLTPYDSPGKAQKHYDYIASDGERRLYQLDLKPGDPIDKDQDGRDLIDASKQPRGIRYYVPYTGDQSLPGWLTMRVRNAAKGIGWGGRATEVEARLGFHFGELVVRYYYKNQEKVLTLTEVEKA